MSQPAEPSVAARRAQRAAADPAVSAWVAANAGTGKTQVLTDRILRLLLAGTKPERILALTYTKAAAAEMSTRVFDRLAGWVTMAPDALAAALSDLCGRSPSADEQLVARRLFASAIETPGGLKVQTIHAFAERLLQRFPLEAGVPPGFAILDDRSADELVRAAVDETLLSAAATPSGALGGALDTIVTYAVDDQFDDLLRDALARRDWLRSMARLATSDALEPTYRGMLGLAPDLDHGTVTRAQATLLTSETLASLAAVFAGGTKSEAKMAPAFAAARNARSDAARIAALTGIFLTQEGKPRERLMTKATGEANSGLHAQLEKARAKFVDLDRMRRSAELLAATLAVARLADAVLQRYAEAKARRAALDFDDLITGAASLLVPAGGSTGAADWVLYKLDGGLDHVLVDEAQDTSPQQWALVEALAAEFFADASRTDLVRTIFAVGDEKQSIYRFQGAAPELLAEMGRRFAERSEAAERGFRHVPLNVSFRSTQATLEVVDRVFADAARTPGVGGVGTIRHVAHRIGQAGLVEVWPIERPDVMEEADPWQPLAEAQVPSPVTRLAQRIAGTIVGWLATGERLASEDRLVTPGDILVLVGRRQPFAPAMVAALKARGVAVAGTDRLLLTEQLAVQDLLVLSDFLVLPEDDLALATVLRSPLFALDDLTLERVATERRGKSLWSRLLEHAQTDRAVATAADKLKTWRKDADFLPPYEFFGRLLEEDGGAIRTRLLARLGIEAADPLDEFLNLALAFDETEPPSLQGFLTWIRGGSHEIKRDMDQGRNEVRVMTVHGAKGLEAPIVFLPDTCGAANQRAGALLDAPAGERPSGIDRLMLWPVKGTADLAPVAAARDAEARLAREERNRLLYVALTRPRDRLYVAGFAGKKEPPPDCWYATISQAVEPLMTPATDADGRPVLRFARPQEAPVERPRRRSEAGTDPLVRPPWAHARVAREIEPSIPLVPSRLAPLDTDAAGEPVEPPPPAHSEPPALPPGLASDTRRFLRGTLTHALLEHLPSLPRRSWASSAARFLDARGAALPAKMRAGIAAEALAILDDARFAPLFGPDSQAEVPIVALLPPPGAKGPPLRLTGQLDRLAVTAEGVMILDYKTNRPPPTDRADVPLAYKLQLAAYRLAVRRIYPGRTVAAAILWTDGARLMEIPADDLDAVEPLLWRAPELPAAL